MAEAFVNGKWVPICGHFFWDNNIVASLFCQQLGFVSGSIKERFQILPNDGLRVGKCLNGDKWPQCTGNCNQLVVGGQCNNGAQCTKGQNAAVSMECIGGKHQIDSLFFNEKAIVLILVAIATRF